MTLLAIEYKLLPANQNWLWFVYAGRDGSILVYKPENDRWERLGQSWGDNGYWVVSMKEGTERVHELVALAFDGPKTREKPTVRHLDGEKDNNESDNIKWGTPGEQQEDERKEGNCRRRAFWKKGIDPIGLTWNSFQVLTARNGI